MKCKVIPSAVGIKRPSIQVWKAATYRINRIHIPIKGKMLYHDINGVRLLDEGSIYFMINSCSQNFEMIPLSELPQQWTKTEIFNTPPQNL